MRVAPAGGSLEPHSLVLVSWSSPFGLKKAFRLGEGGRGDEERKGDEEGGEIEKAMSQGSVTFDDEDEDEGGGTDDDFATINTLLIVSMSPVMQACFRASKAFAGLLRHRKRSATKLMHAHLFVTVPLSFTPFSHRSFVFLSFLDGVCLCLSLIFPLSFPSFFIFFSSSFFSSSQHKAQQNTTKSSQKENGREVAAQGHTTNTCRSCIRTSSSCTKKTPTGRSWWWRWRRRWRKEEKEGSCSFRCPCCCCCSCLSTCCCFWLWWLSCPSITFVFVFFFVFQFRRCTSTCFWFRFWCSPAWKEEDHRQEEGFGEEKEGMCSSNPLCLS